MEKDCPNIPNEENLIKSLTPDESIFNSDNKTRLRQNIVGLARLDRKLEEMIKK